MPTNILKAVLNVATLRRNDLIKIYGGANRLHNMGDALEYFMKDIFCSSLGESSIANKDKIHRSFLSYIGNSNNPPDFIISKGDAVEVKKIESLKTSISLNSSYPKAKLHSDSSLILDSCRNCEKETKWDVKDIIYSIGVTNDGANLRSLWMIYGDCYAASKEVYERIRNKIAEGVTNIDGVKFSDTNELGRVNKVDPLGITYLRIRGMWGIDNPVQVFNYVAKVDTDNKFTLHALMRTTKYNSFPKEDREALEKASNISFTINDVDIKDPDNPAKLIPAKLIKFILT